LTIDLEETGTSLVGMLFEGDEGGFLKLLEEVLFEEVIDIWLFEPIFDIFETDILLLLISDKGPLLTNV